MDDSDFIAVTVINKQRRQRVNCKKLISKKVFCFTSADLTLYMFLNCSWQCDKVGLLRLQATTFRLSANRPDLYHCKSLI